MGQKGRDWPWAGHITFQSQLTEQKLIETSPHRILQQQEFEIVYSRVS